MMNYWRILGNGLAAFCTSAVAALSVGVPDSERIKLACMIALLQGGLALSQEIQKESGGNLPATPTLLVL